MFEKFEKINIKVTLLAALLLLLFLNVFLYSLLYEKEKSLLKVTFLNVGQGDAILIETPSGHRALLDAGPSGAALLRSLSEELYFWQRDFDFALATHADKDHIGGFIDFFKYYKVQNVYEPGLLSGKKSELSESLLLNLARLKEKGVKALKLKRGDLIDFGDGVYILVLFPPAALSSKDSNKSSLVVKLIYGKTSFLLTGDLPQKEEKLLAFFDRSLLQSNVLKLGHHGSYTSSAEEFLRFVKPEYAVVSAGKDNSYGHPHREVIERVQSVGAKLLYTWDGSVRFLSDGEKLYLEK